MRPGAYKVRVPGLTYLRGGRKRWPPGEQNERRSANRAACVSNNDGAKVGFPR